MASDIISFFFDMVSVPGVWFLELMEATGMTGIFLAAFMVFMVIRTLLAPALGHSGSDTASRSRDKEE